MTFYSNSFDGGTVGSAVTAANSGGASGTAFSTTPGSGGSTLTYTATSAHGGVGFQLFQPFSTQGAGYLTWTINGAATARSVFRAYVYIASGTINHPILQIRNASTNIYTLILNNLGVAQLADASGSTIAVATGAMPTGQWMRVEAAVTPGTTTTSGVFETLISYADSNTAYWSNTTSGKNAGSGALTTIRYGCSSGNAGSSDITTLYDDLAADDSGTYTTGQWIGPVVNQAEASLNVATTATASSHLAATTANASLNVATTATATSHGVTTANASLNVATTATSSVIVSSTANASLNVATTATAQAILIADAPASINVSTSAAATSYVPAGYLNPFTIGVYDKALTWQQNIGDPVHATVTPRVIPAVGTAEIEVRATDPVNQWLQTDGARIHVAYRGEHLFSGPVVSYQGDVIPGGTVTYQFEDDSRLFGQTLGWVVPTGHLTATSTSDATQTTPEQAASYQGYYDWGGARTVETAIKQIVTANFSRLGRNVVVNSDLGRGGTVAQTSLPQVRFDTLDTVIGDLLALSTTPLTVTCYQTPGRTHLNVEVNPATTWPQALTYESGVLISGTYSMQTPAATRVVVGGPGQDIARAFQGVNDGTGLEAAYGEVAEVFTDSTSGATVTWPDTVPDASRQERYYTLTAGVSSADIAAFVNTLTAAGQNTLTNAGPTSGIDIQLSETAGFHYGGVDGFHVGDTVTVSAGGQTFTEPITECSLAWTTDNFTVTPTLGKQTNDPDVVLLQAIQLLAKRLRQQGTGR